MQGNNHRVMYDLHRSYINPPLNNRRSIVCKGFTSGTRIFGNMGPYTSVCNGEPVWVQEVSDFSISGSSVIPNVM